jgi:hypothetical protein
MATKKQEAQRNFLEEYITIAKERCDKARAKQFCRLSVEYFEHMAVVTIMIAERVQVAVFLEEDLGSYWPVFNYWLTKEQRAPIVARMYRAGMSGTQIAKFLKFSSATIYKDIAHIRNISPFKLDNRISLKRSDLRQGRLITDGDFKVAALTYEAQLLDMQRAFMESRSATMQ